MKIYKYRLNFDETTISLPCDAKILDIAIQDNEPVLWAIVDPEKSLEHRYIHAFYTGQDLKWPQTLEYIKTIINTDGLIYHFFEQK